MIANTESSVQNGGWISKRFDTESRGIRKGCCEHPLLFILVVELLAIKIMNDDTIKPISISNKTGEKQEIPKILQYADDMNYFLRDEMISLQKALFHTDSFSQCTGLDLEILISKNAWIRSNRHRTEQIGDIPTLKEKENIKMLGIFFNPLYESSETNWSSKNEKVEKIINQWQKYNLTTQGKVMIEKTFILSIWTHVMKSLIIPDDVIKIVDRMLFKFLWEKSHP